MSPAEGLWKAILSEIVPTRSPRTRRAAEEPARRAFASGVFALDYPRGVLRRDYVEPQIVAAVATPGAELEASATAEGLEELGMDAAARAINAVVAAWAEPLFLTARLAVPEGEGDRLLPIVRGIARTARSADATLLALDPEEVSGRFRPGAREVSCCAIGIAEERKAFAKARCEAGDVVIGLSSPPPPAAVPSYSRPILRLLRGYRVKHVVYGMAAVGEDGLLGAIASILPEGLGASLDAGAFAGAGANAGGLRRREILREGSRRALGFGFVLIAAKHFGPSIAGRLTRLGAPAAIIGRLSAGARGVRVRRG